MQNLLFQHCVIKVYIVRSIKSDKMGHVTIINCFIFGKKHLKMGRRDDKQSLLDCKTVVFGRREAP